MEKNSNYIILYFILNIQINMKYEIQWTKSNRILESINSKYMVTFKY